MKVSPSLAAALLGATCSLIILFPLATPQPQHHWGSTAVTTTAALKVVSAVTMLHHPGSLPPSHWKQEGNRQLHTHNLAAPISQPLQFLAPMMFFTSSFLVMVAAAVRYIRPATCGAADYLVLALSEGAAPEASADGVHMDTIITNDTTANAVSKDLADIDERLQMWEKKMKALENKIAIFALAITEIRAGKTINLDMKPEFLLYVNKDGKIDVDEMVQELRHLRNEKDTLLYERRRLLRREEELVEKVKQLRENGTSDESLRDTNTILQEYMEKMMNAQVKDGYLTTSLMYNDDKSVRPMLAFDSEEMPFVVREFYGTLSEQIYQEISAISTDYVYLSGTPGVGKSTFRNYVVWYLLNKFRNQGQKLCIIMARGGFETADLLFLESDGTYHTRRYVSVIDLQDKLEQEGWKAKKSLFCLVDLHKGDDRYIENFACSAIVFTSPNSNAWAVQRKKDTKFFWMPLWEWEEVRQITQKKFPKYARVVQSRFRKYGGVVRVVWGSENVVKVHEGFLSKAPTPESLAADPDDDFAALDEFQHRFIYLDVPKRKGGEYNFTAYPSPQCGTRYLAQRMGHRYVVELYKMLEVPFPNKRMVKLRRDMFEVISLLILQYQSKVSAFYIRILKKKYERLKPEPYVVEQLGKGTRQSKYLYFRPPKTKEIEFDGERDVLNIVNKNLKTPVLALPRDLDFPGFDALLAWKGELQPSSQKQGYSKKKTNDETKYALLLQCTTSMSHPLSDGGLRLLHNFVKDGFTVEIVYIVPRPNGETFPKQNLESGYTTDEVFASTPQWCMYIVPRGPQEPHRLTDAEEEQQ